MYKLGEQHSSARAESVALRCHKKTWRSSAPQWNRRHTVKDNAIGWRYSECDDRGLSTGGIQTSSRVAGARGEQHEKHRVRKTAAHRYWRQGQVKTESTDVDPTGKARRVRAGMRSATTVHARPSAARIACGHKNSIASLEPQKKFLARFVEPNMQLTLRYSRLL